MVPIKNHLFFIKAINQVLSSCSIPIRFFIVGDGEEKENIIEHINEFKIDYSIDYKVATIQLTSWIKEIDEVNAGMDIICLCSLNEGTPVSLIEAQASGNPIVTTRTGGIENIVIENKTALISEINNLNLFVENLLTFINSKEKRKQFTELGVKKSKEFDYKILIKNIKRLYEQ